MCLEEKNNLFEIVVFLLRWNLYRLRVEDIERRIFIGLIVEEIYNVIFLDDFIIYRVVLRINNVMYY